MSVSILTGDVREQLVSLPAESFDCIVTSPPYWGLRDYGVAGQIGLEPTLGEHLAVMVDVFRDLRRVLKPTGTCWVNYGDCYATAPNGRSAAETKSAGGDDRTFRDKPFSTVGPVHGPGTVVSGAYLKPKDLCMIPNRLAIALQDDGWFVRAECIWGKTNPMPDSSGAQRPSSAHEKIFLLTKSGDADVWRARDTKEISFHPDLSERCALITTPERDGPRWMRIGSYYDSDAVMQGGGLSSASEVSAQPDFEGAFAAPVVSAPQRVKMPDGWDTGAGGHGSHHRAGREKGRTIDKQRGHERRHDGFAGRWDAMSKDEQGANGRLLRNYEPAPLTVWEMAVAPFKGAHFATFPPELAMRCIQAGCPPRGSVLDPFGGAGTVGLVAQFMGRDATLIELNPDYAELARARIFDAAPLLADVAGGAA